MLCYCLCSVASTQMFTTANGDRTSDSYPNFLVILTDRPSINAAATWQAALQARASGTTIIAVSFTAMSML